MRKLLQLAILFSLFRFPASAQPNESFTRQDTLRGSDTPERAWWDALKYDITIEADPSDKTIKGENILTFKARADGKKLQLDLQKGMNIEGITIGTHGEKHVSFARNGNVFYAVFDSMIKKDSIISLRIKFAGEPREAVNPPWDGGWIWKYDTFGNPWISAACQSLGASVWYPCKDYQGDEPDSAALSITVPDSLVGIGNGRLSATENLPGGKIKYTWTVSSPINNYNVIPYIGKYVHWSGKYHGEKGILDVDYWVLKQDEQKARKQFVQVPQMLQCFEYWFGPYPFYQDGYKLVQSPHLGMEHQSAIAYGNKFENGYLGKDLSGTGWGDKWDFIIVHESAHEWFGNSITTNDIADMWVHEGFTNYSEVLFTQCRYGKKAGNEYCIGLRQNIKNDRPVIGPYGVNREGSDDMYFKGANVVHMIRQIINNDEKFRQMLRNMNKMFYHKTVNTQDIEKYVSKTANRNLQSFFDQYLRTTMVPVLEYTIAKGKLNYRWSNCVGKFNMPVKVKTDKSVWLYPTTKWKSMTTKSLTLAVDPNFYVGSSKM
jgi:aminopeptidase N